MNTKALRQKILDLAIHGRLVPPVCRQAGKDPNDEPASVLLQRIHEEKERLIKEGKIKKGKKSAKTSDTAHYENVPFEVPESWEWTTLGEIGTWQSGATPSRLQKDYYGGNIPWLKTGDLTDGVITEIPENITDKALNETSVKLNPSGSVLIAMYGATIGKIGILSFPATTNQACCACIDYKVEQMYLFYFLLANRENFIRIGGGGAQPNISKEKILHTQIPLPPLAEQRRIVAEIERWFSLIDIIETNKASLQTSVKQAKAKILDLAIHGKLVPPVCRQAGKTLQANPDPRIEERKCWFTYVIECKDGSFYKGYTDNLLRRYHQHCIGTGAQYTKVHKPKQLYYWEMHYSEEAALEREKYLKSGAGREWFKKEVVNKPDDFEPASELLRRINPKAEITSDNAPFEVPSGWCRCRLHDVVTIINGRSQKDVEDANGNYPIYGSGGIIGRATDYLCEAGSTIIGRKGTINNPIFVDERFWNIDTAFGMKPQYAISDLYFYYFCKSFDFSKLDKSTALPSLKQSTIGGIYIPLPPLAEQHRIVAKIEEIFARLDRIEAEL